MIPMNLIDELKSSIRPIQDGDIHLPRVSYSKLSVLHQCPYKFFLQYEKHKTSKTSTIALDVGTFCHAILEDKEKWITGIEAASVDYKNVKKTQEYYSDQFSLLKARYWEEWDKTDKSGLDYTQKFEKFWEYYPNAISEKMDDGLLPFASELAFNFVFEDRVIITGFIDRIDVDSNGEFYVTDYKTSNTVFNQNDLDYSQQFFTYALAILNEYGKIPVEYEYDFIFLGEKAKALTKKVTSFQKCYEKMHSSIDEMFALQKSRKYYPKPSPLCHWCNYCCHSISTDKQLNNLCDYYSLWQPNDKVFKNNKKVNALSFNADSEFQLKEKARLIW